MRLIADLLFVFGLALLLGLGLTHWATNTDAPFGTVAIGPWRAHTGVGTPSVDAYALANLARRGELPLAIGDGLMFRAEVDDEEKPLNGRCLYEVEGLVPSARVWTLSLYDKAGQVLANPAERYAFTDTEAGRSPTGNIRILVAPKVQPGDWLPSQLNKDFVLALRLYDTTASTLTERAGGVELPRITRGACQ